MCVRSGPAPLIFLPTPPPASEAKRGLTLAAPTSTLTPWHHQHPTNPAHKRKARKRRPFGEIKCSVFQPRTFWAQHLCLMPAQKKLSLKASVTSVLLFLHLGEQEPQTGFLFKEDSRGSSLPCLNHEGMLRSPDGNI